MQVEDFINKAQKVVSHLNNELAKIRTGRANTSLVEDIKVDAYGELVPLYQLATITVSDVRTMVITPWDKNLVTKVVEAIQKSGLGINPVVDGDDIRLVIPPITEERRKDLIKIVNKYVEEAKVSLRNLRREFLDLLEKRKKDEKLPDNYVKSIESSLESEVKKIVQKIDDIAKQKSDEILKH